MIHIYWYFFLEKNVYLPILKKIQTPDVSFD
jgi:hypothetical protein